MDGLSQLKGVKNISQFAVHLANGLGSNLKKITKDAFFNEVFYILFLLILLPKESNRLLLPLSIQFI